MSQSDASSSNLGDKDDSPGPEGDSTAKSRIPKPEFGTLEYRLDEGGSPPVKNPDESIQGLDPQTRNAASSYEPCEYHDHSFPPPTDGKTDDPTLKWLAIVFGLIVTAVIIACAMNS